MRTKVRILLILIPANTPFLEQEIQPGAVSRFLITSLVSYYELVYRKPILYTSSAARTGKIETERRTQRIPVQQFQQELSVQSRPHVSAVSFSAGHPFSAVKIACRATSPNSVPHCLRIVRGSALVRALSPGKVPH